MIGFLRGLAEFCYLIGILSQYCYLPYVFGFAILRTIPKHLEIIMNVLIRQLRGTCVWLGASAFLMSNLFERKAKTLRNPSKMLYESE